MMIKNIAITDQHGGNMDWSCGHTSISFNENIEGIETLESCFTMGGHESKLGPSDNIHQSIFFIFFFLNIFKTLINQ